MSDIFIFELQFAETQGELGLFVLVWIFSKFTHDVQQQKKLHSKCNNI